MMPFAVQVHHAFVDGIHIDKLEDKLKKYLDANSAMPKNE
jgi:chloramphenicol O-acetyltransferase